MRNKITTSLLTIGASIGSARMLFADSVNVTESHTSTTKTTTYTLLGMDQTTGVIVIAAAVIVVLLIIFMASRSSSRTETTIIK